MSEPLKSEELEKISALREWARKYLSHIDMTMRRERILTLVLQVILVATFGVIGGISFKLKDTKTWESLIIAILAGFGAAMSGYLFGLRPQLRLAKYFAERNELRKQLWELDLVFYGKETSDFDSVRRLYHEILLTMGKEDFSLEPEDRLPAKKEVITH